MAVGYRHLSYEERVAIATLSKEGLSLAAIARRLGRSASTVSHEVKRNRGGKGYRAGQAQGKAEGRRSAASSVPRKLGKALWARVADKLRLQWSPERIAGWLELEGIARISCGWIHARIRADRRAGGHLWAHLRRQGRKRKRRPLPGAAGRGLIPGRVDISERPAAAGTKSRVGDWEVDTVIGAGHKGVLVTAVDRMSKYVLFQAVPRKTAALVGEALVVAGERGVASAAREAVAANLDLAAAGTGDHLAEVLAVEQHRHGSAGQPIALANPRLGGNGEDERR